MTLSPSGLQVLIAGLTGVAEEMGAVLQRAAFSPNIKERADCSAAVFDADGELLAQAEHIPVHLGSMPASVAAVIADLGDRLRPGDQAIVNDPYRGGTHLNDVTVVAPCHVDGRLVGWVANRAHHADVGGAAPGSLPADATDIHQEGLRLPPLRLTPEVRAVLLAASRTPWERAGDLDAQVGANVVGVARLAGFDGAPFDEVLDYGERRCRAAPAAAPAGRWSAEDVLDSTGPAPDQQRPATIRCTVASGPDGIVFDLTGTDQQRAGNTNAVRAVTVSAVSFALRSVLDHTLPANAGVLRPVRLVAPEGTLVAARSPAAVGAGNVEGGQRIVDVCQRALAAAMPERVPAASQGTMNNLLIGSVGGDGAGPAGGEAGDRAPWVYYETIGGGQGGRPPRPDAVGARPVRGMSGVHTGMTNTRNTPVEALERTFPMRVLRYRLRRESGGAGGGRGGGGRGRDAGVLGEGAGSLTPGRGVHPPWGLAGGGAGAVGENWLLPGGSESAAVRLPDKVTLQLRRGDVVRVRTPGGGGWGRPGA